MPHGSVGADPAVIASLLPNWSPGPPPHVEERRVLEAMGALLQEAGVTESIGLIVSRSPKAFRAVVDGRTGAVEVLDRRLVDADAAAVLVMNDDTATELVAGDLSPFAAIRSDRFRFTGNYGVLLGVLTVLSRSTTPIPAPCEGAT